MFVLIYKFKGYVCTLNLNTVDDFMTIICLKYTQHKENFYVVKRVVCLSTMIFM